MLRLAPALVVADLVLMKIVSVRLGKLAEPLT